MKTERVTIAEMKERNAAAGYFFLSRDTMRFFDSKVHGQGYRAPDGIHAYFVTSEKFMPSTGIPDARLYTVRVIDLITGNVDTWPDHSGFQQYRTLADARFYAQRAARS